MRSLAVLVLLSACSPTQRAWRAAKRLDTAEAYRQFAREDPTHPRRPDALARVEQLDWEHAVTRGNAEAWANFVAFHPNSPRIADARAQLEAARWKEANEQGTRQGFELYLANHPMGPNADQARAQLDAIAWAEADRDASIESYGRYMVRYRDGAHVAEASEKREALIWQQAVAADGPLEYKAYVDRYPQGKHVREARAALEGFRFSGVAIQLVVRRTEQPDSLKSWKAAVMETLGAELARQRFKVAWLEPVDARGRPELDALDGLLVAVPEDHAALVVDLEERRGRDFAPSGNATDIVATVSLVPPGRTRPMEVKAVKGTTSAKVSVANEAGLHLDAQRQFGAALAQAGFPLRDWQR